jgi:Pre ATP-grasp domain/PGM1 C-terminal domain
MAERSSRTILANTNSDTMAEHPTPGYLRAMAVVTPRTLWEARRGDCAVLLAPPTRAFRDYVASVVGVEEVEIIAPPEIAAAHPLNVAAGLGALDRVTARPELEPFALDQPVLEFVRRTGVRLVPYAQPPADDVLAVVRRLNTKSGIRETALELGLPVADGGHAVTLDELVAAVVAFLAHYPSVIIKTDRSSTGFGNLVFQAGPDVAGQVRAAVAGQPAGGCGWVYEEFLPLTASPSVEMVADDDGVTVFYSCDQRTTNNAWTGMVAPAGGERYEELCKASAVFGEWLHAQGYRGVFDVDCGVHAEGYVITEANVRTTGGTYLEKLARLLRPAADPVHWRADGRRGGAALEFGEAVRRVAALGLGDASSATRAVLTTDTHDVDGKWRYLVVGPDAGSVAEAERAVEDVLGIGVTP